ncbi:MAG: acetolactate synthase [Candidatus Nanopelagicales bacterium]|jgi:acetolactate synthase-1/2/3 large subunit|nr:acetolactate synthase [Candidatus Nanopelagicales bacterium]
MNPTQISGHGGHHVLAAARAHGATTLFTLSGAHIFPLYDAAVGGKPGFDAAPDRRSAERDAAVRLLDVRHEATAVFAAEATGRLDRTPGFAAVTAGPGVTNAVSALATGLFNGAPMVVVGGRAPEARWGSGSLQEFDHPALLGPVTKAAWTLKDPATIGARSAEAFRLALTPHRGPVFLDVPMDLFYFGATAAAPTPVAPAERAPDPSALDRAGAVLAAARTPVVVLSSDVWSGFAEKEAVDLVTEFDLPAILTGLGRGVLPPGHPSLVTRARSAAFKGADVVVVVGAPLDFRLGYGVFGNPSSPAKVIHLTDASDPRRPDTVEVAVRGDLPLVLRGLVERLARTGTAATPEWAEGLRAADGAARDRDGAVLASTADPIHPARIYGELLPRLADDAVTIGDGGDFVSFAGKYIEPAQPGCWLDPGPFGCLGTGLGYAIGARVARPGAQVTLLLGDGAAGFSLMDVDTLVRHDLPVVMVMGNNSGWGLERGPMQMLHGYGVATELAPSTRYDEVVRALGGAGEMVTDPEQIGPALDRAYASGVPYLVNVITDPTAMYPRTTTGI